MRCLRGRNRLRAQSKDGAAVISGMSRLAVPPIFPAAPDRLDWPPRAGALERRLTRRALAAWQAGDGGPVLGFDAHALVIADPGGRALVESVGSALAAAFGITADAVLNRAPGIRDELSALCELVTLHPVPVPFEAGVPSAGGAELMVRGIALPLLRGDDPAGAVQIICNWRVVLERSAAVRLRRELGSALREVRSTQQALRSTQRTQDKAGGWQAASHPVADPFAPEFGVKLDE